MAVDPADPNHIVAASNLTFPTAPYFSVLSRFYTTFDGGHTWTSGTMPREPRHNYSVDPWIVFDSRHGTVLYAMINWHATPTDFCQGDVVVSISRNGGLDWDAPVPVARGRGCVSDRNWRGFDIATLAADNYPGSPFFGTIYLATRLGTYRNALTAGPTFEAQSSDGGSTWSAPRVISGSNATYCQKSGPVCSANGFGQLAVAPDGSVHAAFENYQHSAAWEPHDHVEAQIMVVTSSDGGATWSDPVHVVDLEDGAADWVDGYALTGSALPGSDSIEAYLTAAPTGGALYVAFADNRNGAHDVKKPVTNADIFVMTSEDGGQTWTGPDVVSDAPGDQWFPFADVNPVTGELGVLFYDRSYGAGDTYELTLATGAPGSPFSRQRITSESSHLTGDLWFTADVPECMDRCVSWIGDYHGFAYGSDGTANMIWTDMRRYATVPGVGSGYMQNTFYARDADGVSAVSAQVGSPATNSTLSVPAIQIQPTSGPAGTLIAVKGTGFIAPTVCSIVISFTDASGLKTTLKVLDAVARFKTTVTIPGGAPVGDGTIDAFQRHPAPLHGCLSGGSDPTASFTVTRHAK